MKSFFNCLFYITLFFVNVNLSKSQSKEIVIHKFTVEQCVEHAFNYLADIQNGKIDIKLQNALNKEYTGMALPQISAKSNNQRMINLPQSFFPDIFGPSVTGILNEYGVKDKDGKIIEQKNPGAGSFVSFVQPWNISAGFTISQIIFEPNVFVSLVAARELMNSANVKQEVNKDKVKENVLKLYYSSLILQKRLDLLNLSIINLKNLLNEIEGFYQQGLREKLDVDRTKVALTNLLTARQQLISVNTSLYNNFKLAIGVPTKDSLNLTSTLNDQLLILNFDEINTFDINKRNDYKLLQSGLKLQEINLKRNKLLFGPTVVAAFDYTYNTVGQNLSSLFGTNNSFSASLFNLNITLPIFTGFSQRQRLNQAKFQVEKLNNTIEQAKNAIEAEIKSGQENYMAALQNLNAQKENLQLAQEIFETSKKKYDVGVIFSFELIDASNQKINAESKYYEAYLDVINAKIALQKALGNIQNTF